MVVNLQGDVTSENIYYLTDRVSFPVYQDTTSLNIWSILDGGKDDILVYDRCGQLTYHARLPYSNLYYNVVERAIKYTFFGYDPCSCPPTTTQAMTSDPATEMLTTLLYTTNLLDDIEEEEETELENEEQEAEQDNDEDAEQDNDEEVEQGNEQEAKQGNEEDAETGND